MKRIHYLPLVNLAKIRRAADLTQSDLAARLNRTGPYIAALEAGKRPATEEDAIAVADALGVSLDVLCAESIRIDITSPSGAITVTRA